MRSERNDGFALGWGDACSPAQKQLAHCLFPPFFRRPPTRQPPRPQGLLVGTIPTMDRSLTNVHGGGAASVVARGMQVVKGLNSVLSSSLSSPPGSSPTLPWRIFCPLTSLGADAVEGGKCRIHFFYFHISSAGPITLECCSQASPSSPIPYVLAKTE